MDNAPKPVVVSPNAGLIDLLTALGRYLTVIATTIPILLTLFGTRDIIGLIAYFQTEDGVKFTAAVGGVATLLYGLWKTQKRGAQLVEVAADPAVPNRVAQLSQ